MSRSLGVGIIGVGTIGRLHLEAARRLGATVVAVAGRDPALVRALGDDLGVAAHTDYRALLDDPAVTVVHICTPNVLHYPMARDALLAGKHVVCEKPLTLTSAESADLLALAGRSGRVHAVGFNNRFYPLVQEARARVADGRLGRVFAVRGFILEDSLLSEQADDWRLDPAQGGDSCAMSTIGCHLIDLVCFILDSPIRAVCADFTTVHPVRRRPSPGGDGAGPGDDQVPVQSEEVASLLVQLASGARGVLGVSRAAAGRRYSISLEVDGTESSLAWRSEAPNQLWLGHDARPNELLLRDPALLSPSARPFAAYPGAYQEAFPDTLKALLDRIYLRIAGCGEEVADFPTFADGHAALLVHEAVLTSARTRTWIDVPDAVGADRGGRRR